MEPKDRLPIGISLLALAVAIAALVVAVSDSDSDDAVDESETSVTAPVTTQAFQTTTTVGHRSDAGSGAHDSCLFPGRDSHDGC